MPDQTASTDFANVSQKCLDNKIRLIADTVMAFGYDPYGYINFETFHTVIGENPDKGDSDNWKSSRDWEPRKNWGGRLWRYNRDVKTYNPENGKKTKFTPARMFHRAHLAWWMSHYILGGFRLDSIENVSNWEFLREFRSDAYRHFKPIYGQDADIRDRFLIIGEELSMPIDLVQGPRKQADALWNEGFQQRVRAAIVGEGWRDNFEWTVKKMIDCTLLNFGGKALNYGGKVINYITSHDTENYRKERLCDFLDEFHLNTEEKKQRSKLAFACLLTSIGIPMIFEGEEFCDEGDQPLKDPYKQRDPVNWKRKNDPWRTDVFNCVSRLVKLRKESPALTNLTKGSTSFIHMDFDYSRRIMAWVRRAKRNGGTGGDLGSMVVVVANFSDEKTPGPVYHINGWPAKSEEQEWYEVIADHKSPDAGTETLRAWDVKVYKLVTG